MYHMLLRISLFQGMSRTELFEVLEQTTFHFRKVEDGKIVFQQGELCGELAFLMSGTLVADTLVPQANFTFSEEFSTHMIIEPQSLFGKQPCYKSTYTAKGDVSLLCIDKREVYELLEAYEIFRINLINTLCSKAENLHERLWAIAPHGLEGRIVLFVRSLCTTYQGTKVLRIKMEDLACLFDDTRLNVSRILNKWQSEGIIEMRRKEFVFHEVEKLFSKMCL